MIVCCLGWRVLLLCVLVVATCVQTAARSQANNQAEPSDLTWDSWGKIGPDNQAEPSGLTWDRWPDFSGPTPKEPTSKPFRGVGGDKDNNDGTNKNDDDDKNRAHPTNDTVTSSSSSSSSSSNNNNNNSNTDAYMGRGASRHHVPLFRVSVANFIRDIRNIINLFFLGLAAVLLWKRRRDVLMLLTGEDRIHGSPLQATWWTCFRCCGTCSHEWTRSVSRLPCCPAELHGTNLVREAGASLGVATQTVEFSNIVVGDLPTVGRADFYLSFEYSANPAIKTSVAEAKLPKVVHFPEILTLRIRHSRLAGNLIISAYKLDLVGSVLLCRVALKAPNIIAWSKGEVKTRRFAMRSPKEEADTDPGLRTPPWIALEITTPITTPKGDMRQLDRLASTDTVRTSMSIGPPVGYHTGTGYQLIDMPVAEVKERYALLNSAGEVVMEPPEANLGRIQLYRDMVALAYSTCSLFSMFLLVSLLLGRSYLSSCWDQWRLLTMAMKLHPNSVPFSRQLLVSLGEQCDELMEGTGTPIGAHGCRPSSEQIAEVCIHLPASQPEPIAFAKLGEKFFRGGHRRHAGLTCQRILCRQHDTLEYLDTALLVMASFLFVFACFLLRPCANQLIAMVKLRSARSSLRDESTWSRSEFE